MDCASVSIDLAFVGGLRIENGQLVYQFPPGEGPLVDVSGARLISVVDTNLVGTFTVMFDISSHITPYTWLTFCLAFYVANVLFSLIRG